MNPFDLQTPRFWYVLNLTKLCSLRIPYKPNLATADLPADWEGDTLRPSAR